MVRIVCTVCRQAMKTMQIQPPNRDPVTLDACFGCGGIWFDAGELEAASKHRLTHRPENDAIDRDCPRCPRGTPLYEETLQGKAGLAYACDRCKGLFITGEGVDTMLHLHRALPEEKALPPPQKQSWFERYVTSNNDDDWDRRHGYYRRDPFYDPFPTTPTQPASMFDQDLASQSRFDSDPGTLGAFDPTSAAGSTGSTGSTGSSDSASGGFFSNLFGSSNDTSNSSSNTGSSSDDKSMFDALNTDLSDLTDSLFK